MKKQAASLAEFKKKCRESGLRVTPQRTAVYDAAKDDRTHPSADDIYRKVSREYPDISFDTVNRTLLTFVDIGVLNIAESHNRQKRFDSNTDRHHHISCIRCGRIIDFENSDYDHLEAPDDIESRYQVLGKRVVIECICDKCSDRSKRGGRK